MKRSIVFFVLVLSVAFNVFFVLGAMRVASSAEPHTIAEAAPSSAVATRPVLKLDKEQRSVYDEVAATHKDRRDRLLEEQALIREELINAFNGAAPNRDKIRTLIDQHVEITHRIQADSAARFDEFLSALSPMQRKHVAERVRAARQGNHDLRPLPPALRHFDIDGDGRLNPREAHRARAARRVMGEHRWNRLNNTRPRPPIAPQRDRNGGE